MFSEVRLAAVPKKYEGIDFKPPASVAEQAEKGLEYRRRSGKGGLSSQEAGKEGIGSGVQRAVNLKNRNNLTPETIGMMLGFFSRHEKNKAISSENQKTPWEDAGYVAWLLWGGDEGRSWAEKVKKQMEDADEKEAEEKKKAVKKAVQNLSPRVPLLEIPVGKVQYRIKADTYGILVGVYLGNKRIAHMDAYSMGGFSSLRCQGEILDLLGKYPEMEDTSRPRWKPEIPRINYISVSHSEIRETPLRGLGIGKAMYLAVMREWFDRNGPFFFMPDSCNGVGVTSEDAKRVWASLKKMFPHSGNVLAVLQRPSIPVGKQAMTSPLRLQRDYGTLDKSWGPVLPESKTASETGKGTGAGVFIPLPEEIAKQFPALSEDTSKPHVTFLYVGDVTGREEIFEKAVQDFFLEERGPIIARLAGVDYFTNQLSRVAYSRVHFSTDMGAMRDRLASKLEDIGFKIENKFPLAYLPHVTLEYMQNPHERWTGHIPVGEWHFHAVEVWGLPKLIEIPLGPKDPPTTTLLRIQRKREASRKLFRDWFGV